MAEIIAGLILIAAGLARSESVFLGDFGARPILLDTIGVLGLLYGIVRLRRAKQSSSPPPHP